MRVMDSAPGRTTYQRLPGLTFLPCRQSRRQPLPRLDVAAFVGFAERGPLHVPVPIEDTNTYRAVFGGDLDLAQEIGGGLVKANLPRAVEQFFANGGQRCYVVRVAGRQAEATRLRVPGMVAMNGHNGPRLAALSASSPGAWGANLRLAARLAVTPLPCRGLDGMATCITTSGSGVALHVAAEVLRRSGAPTLYVGDVLRLHFGDNGRWLAIVTAVERLAPTGSIPETLIVHIGAIYQLLPRLEASPPEEVTLLELVTVEGVSTLGTVGPLMTAGERTVLALDAADVPRLSAGDVVRLHLASRPSGDLVCLVRIEEIRALPGSTVASPPQPVFAALFSEFLQLSPDTTLLSPPPPLSALELLRVDLMLRLGDERFPAMVDLAFNPGYPRFWGDAVLLESSPLLRRNPANVTTDRAQSGLPNPHRDSAAWYRRLVRDPFDLMVHAGPPAERNDDSTASQSFNPLAALAGLLAPAGSHLGLSWQAALNASAGGGAIYVEAQEELTLTYLPLGLPEIVDETDPAQLRPPEEGRAGNDDLATFDVSVFYDRYLAPPGAPGGCGPGESPRTLMQTAFDLHYVQGRDLRGLHSLLFLDDVAVVAAPDACHDPWQPGEIAPSPTPPRPAPVDLAAPCPPVADFAACNRPPAIREIEPYFGRFDAETAVTRGVNVLAAVRRPSCSSVRGPRKDCACSTARRWRPLRRRAYAQGP